MGTVVQWKKGKEEQFSGFWKGVGAFIELSQYLKWQFRGKHGVQTHKEHRKSFDQMQNKQYSYRFYHCKPNPAFCLRKLGTNIQLIFKIKKIHIWQKQD